MAFYSDFAGNYEKIFPYREGVFAFLDQWFPKSGRVLDVGCGTGGYCRALTESGRICLGVDLDPDMISEAGRLHPEGDFRVLGMENIDSLPTGNFDAIMCIGNVLPHLPADSLSAFLLDIKRLLVPGGVWIFQTVNFDPILKLEEFVFPELHFAAEGLTFLRRYENIGPDRLTFRTSLVGTNEEFFNGETTLYPRPSADYILEHNKAGFSNLGHFADFGGHEFIPEKNSGSVFVFRNQE